MSVRFVDVAFTYPGVEGPSLREVDLAWEGPGLRLVTGRMGAGCSTLLLLASGLAPRVTGGSRRGRVTVFDIDPADPAGARELAGRVALLLPTPWTQLSGMTYRVRDEIAFGPANLGWARDRIEASVDRAVARLALADLVDRDPVTLSGGELQRVMLAGLIAMDPDILLLDEPGLELDPSMADHVTDLLCELATGTMVVVATSDVDRLARRADTALVLDQGRPLVEGPPPEALREPVAVQRGVTTTIGRFLRESGISPLPLDVDEAVEALRGR